MCNTEIPIANRHQLIVVPIVEAVSKSILNGLGAEAFNKVVMQSEISGFKTAQDKREVTMQGDRVMVIKFEEITTRDSQAMGVSSYPMAPPVIEDELLGVSVSALYSSSTIKIKLTGAAASRNEVKGIFDLYFSRINQNQETIVHDVEYRYDLHPGVVSLLGHIHSLRESKAGYGDTFKDYVRAHSSSSLSMTYNAAGTVGGMVIEERQTRIPGSLRPSVHDNENFSKLADTGVYEYTVECELIVNMPRSLSITYPIMIHNTLIHSDFIPKPYVDQHNIDVPGTIYGCLTAFERPKILGASSRDVTINIPKYDTFVPGWPDQPDLVCLATIMTQVDPERPNYLLNLRDLGDYMIDSEVLSFMHDNRRDVINFQESVFKINLYADNSRLHDELLVLTDDLDLELSTGELSERTTYRVSLNVLNGLMLLSSKGWRALLANPRILAILLVHANPMCAKSEMLKSIASSTKMSAAQELWVMRNKVYFQDGETNDRYFQPPLDPQRSIT